MSQDNQPTSPPDTGQIDPADAEPRTPLHLQGARRREFQVIFDRAALDAIHDHGRSRTDVEICGVLVGRLHRDQFGPYLLIRDIVRGDEAAERAAQVTFTAETWERIHAEMESRFPDEKIVGWYHTHPGFGIFLSGMDLFIQEHFFNLPWQVAFVYDPVGGDEGLFVWRDGKCVREPYLVEQQQGGTDWQKLARQRSDSPRRSPRSGHDAPPTHAVPWLALACFLLSFAATWAFFMFHGPTPTEPSTQPTTTESVP